MPVTTSGKATALGTCVSALQVGRIGNTPISAAEVADYIERELLEGARPLGNEVARYA